MRREFPKLYFYVNLKINHYFNGNAAYECNQIFTLNKRYT